MDDYAINLVLSIAFTWILGLIIPIILRYLIFKRTIRKSYSFIISIALLLGQLYLYIAVFQSESNTHFVLFLLAYISYKILSGKNQIKPTYKSNTQKIQINNKDIRFFSKPDNKQETYKISAIELFEAFGSENSKTDNKYANKFIEVSGIISDTGYSVTNNLFFTLETGYRSGSIFCEVKRKFENGFRRIKVGDKLVLKGMCIGKANTDVTLVNCYRVEI